MGNSRMDQIFAEAKSRNVLPTVILAMMLPYIVIGTLMSGDWIALESPIYSLVLGTSSYLVVFGVLWVGWCSKYNAAIVFGALVDRGDAARLMSLGIPLAGVAVFCFYLVFLPLSYVTPGFVELWLSEDSYALVPAGQPDALLVNIGYATMIIVIAPVAEELLFRGFILGRWAAKHGLRSGVLISSILFALVHDDILGALVFAFVLSLIRIKYDSLVAPVLVHIGNNIVGVLWGLVSLFIVGTEYNNTLQDFRSGWWVAVLGAVVGFPWLYRYYKRELVGVRWRDHDLHVSG